MCLTLNSIEECSRFRDQGVGVVFIGVGSGYITGGDTCRFDTNAGYPKVVHSTGLTCHESLESHFMNKAPTEDRTKPDFGVNLLPAPSRAFLIDPFLDQKQSFRFFSEIEQQVQWQSREILIFGKRVLQPRLVSWQGDSGCDYRYSGTTWTPDPWSPAVSRIRKLVSEFTGELFNGVLINMYRGGQDSMGWHSDDEVELGKAPVIASISLGGSRRFLFRKKENLKEKREVVLKDGSLLVMEGSTQELWQHSIPRSAKVKEARINLTFRRIVGD
jgi:alkylated DNA repair dioxygenase AlkB